MKPAQILNRLLLSTIGLAGRPRADARSEPTHLRQILLIRTDRIGDALISIPALRRLRQRHPDARITLLLGPKNKSVAPLIPFVDEILVPESPSPLEWIRLIGSVRRRAFDAAVSLPLKPSRTALAFLAASGAPIAISTREPGLEYLAVDSRHVVPRTIDLLGRLGVEGIGESRQEQSANSIELAGNSTDGSGSGILLHLSAGAERRTVPSSIAIPLACRLAEEFGQVLITAAPAEADRGAAVAATNSDLTYVPTSNLSELAATAASARLAVMPDTAVSHLCAATRTPTVVIFGSSEPARAWYPWGVPHRTVISEAWDTTVIELVIESAAQLIETASEMDS